MSTSYDTFLVFVDSLAALLVLGALASAGITDLGSGDPRKWVADAA
jgi:hypothetical protein